MSNFLDRFLAKFFERLPKRRQSQSHYKAPPSPLNKRILGVNIIAVAILGIGFLYLGHYQKQLIGKELDLMVAEAGLFSAALQESGVLEGELNYELNNRAEKFVRRLAQTADKKALLFSAEGILLANSERGMSLEENLEASKVPLNRMRSDFMDGVNKFTSAILNMMPGGDVQRLPFYPYTFSSRIQAYPNAQMAMNSTLPSLTAWRSNDDEIILTAALPIMDGENIIGILQLEKGGESIRNAINSLRMDILFAFLGGLLITILLSFYLAGTIATPLRLLATAADDIRRSKRRNTNIPDFSERQDEIAMLAESLHDMTEALWNKMDAIERFAADVSHELKNPLTSIKSALETAARIKDPEKKQRLMDIIDEDVTRLDRLITDISEASRVDSELSKAELSKLDLVEVLEDVVALYSREERGVQASLNPVILEINTNEALILGHGRRLSQVFKNLIDNALSFSPEGAPVNITLSYDNQASPSFYQIQVTDKGPGIMVEKIEKIFSRFYTERPSEQGFGNHSGLGLNIAKQIVEAHEGTIEAQNLIDRQGQVEGCEFKIQIPVLKRTSNH